MASEWFYRIEDRRAEPVSATELKALADAGIIAPTTLVRKGTEGEWVPARQVKGLCLPPPRPDRRPAPPPVPLPARHGTGPVATPPVTRRIRWLPTAAVASAAFTVLLVGILLLPGNGGKEATSGSSRSVAPQKQASSRFSSGLAGSPNDAPGKEAGDADTVTVPLVEKREDAAQASRLQPRAPLSATDLYTQASPAVVTIILKDEQDRPLGTGSGFFLSAESLRGRYGDFDVLQEAASAQTLEGHPMVAAYVLTNYHVIKWAVTAEVVLKDGTRASVFGVAAEEEKKDLALLSALVPSGKPVTTLPLADGEGPAIGATVFAIGSPKGLGTSLSQGLISAEREVAKGSRWLQTTAAISPGSSGGPLLNSEAEVVGVTTASLVDGQNLNFCVPASEARRFLQVPFSSRPMWRGRSFRWEAEHADQSFHDWATANLQAYAKSILLFVEGAAKLQEAIQHEDETQAAEVVSKLDAASKHFPDEYRYFLYYNLGRAHTTIWLAQWSKSTSPYETGPFGFPVIRRFAHREKAIECFEESLRLNPQFSPPYYWIATCRNAPEEYAEALVAAESLVRLLPYCSDAFVKRGQCLLSPRRNGKALQDFQTAVEINPNNADARFLMGTAYKYLREYEKAAEAYEHARQLGYMPGDPHLYYCIGESYQGARQYKKAIAAFEKAKQAGKDKELCDRRIAECYAAMRQ